MHQKCISCWHWLAAAVDCDAALATVAMSEREARERSEREKRARGEQRAANLRNAEHKANAEL